MCEETAPTVARIPLRLGDFDISEETGFLMESPLERLPEYFRSWNDLAEKMPRLVKNKTFRQRVIQMPLLDHNLLTNDKQKRLANLQLTLIATGYIWQDGDDMVPTVLPAGVSVPLWNVSEELGIKPVISHPGLFLANWKLRDPTKTPSLENIQCNYNLPGGKEATSFIAIFNTIEMQFAPGLKYIVKGTEAVDYNDVGGLVCSLNGIQEAINSMKSTFSKIHGLVSTETFYNEIQPFLEGWGYGSSALPGGLIYEGINDIPAQFSGDTGAQTSILASIDAFLSVKHHKESQDFLLRMRDYMPPAHRRFIEALEDRPSTYVFVKASSSDRLLSAYNSCISTLTEFRSYHINIVTKYIVVPSKKDKVDSNDSEEPLAVKGTGGTNPMPFLKGVRSDTEGNTVST